MQLGDGQKLDEVIDSAHPTSGRRPIFLSHKLSKQDAQFYIDQKHRGSAGEMDNLEACSKGLAHRLGEQF